MIGKIKIRRSDTLFREYLLKLRGEVCEKCGQKGAVQVSHFYGRRSESVRYDPQNTSLLCFTCHRKFHERPSEYTEWKRKQLGEREYKKLMLRANQYRKRDDKLMVITLKALNKLST